MFSTSGRTVMVVAILTLGSPAVLACGETSSPEASKGSLLTAGTEVPELETTDHRGQKIKLSEEGSIRLIYFYPKDGTPGCTKEACAIRDTWDRFVEAKIEVIGVSADDLDSHRAFAEEHELPFGLVADPDLVWAKAFGVGTTLGFTQRVSFLIDEQGKVAQVYPGVDPAVHAEEVLSDAAKLTGSAPD
jgi:peroxiredoxin Q/BCP